MFQRRNLAAIQESIVNGILASVPGLRRQEVAAVAGVNPSQVSHWLAEDDSHRDIRLPELVALVRQYGADVVLAPLAAISGCIVLRPAADALANPAAFRRYLWSALGHVEQATAADSAGGAAWTQDEAVAALPHLEAAHAELTRMLAECRAAAVGVG